MELNELSQVFSSTTLDNIFYTIVIFVMGALNGIPLWNWISKKLPWFKQ